MNYLRLIGQILVALGLILRLFVPSQRDNGAIIATVGGLLVAAALVATFSRGPARR